MWELDCEESWVLKNWCFCTVVLEKTLESPLDCKEIQPVHSEGDQLWVFFGRTDAKAETPILWPAHVKSWLLGENSDAGRDWGQKEKGTTEDDGWMASPTRWMWVWVNSRGWWWTGRPGVLRFIGSQIDTTERLNWTEMNHTACGTPVIFLNWKSSQATDLSETVSDLTFSEIWHWHYQFPNDCHSAQNRNEHKISRKTSSVLKQMNGP